MSGLPGPRDERPTTLHASRGERPSSASTAVAAVRFPRGPASPASRARPANAPSAGGRGCGQATPLFVAADLVSPPATGRVALKRGQLDAAIAGLLFHGGDAAERGERPALEQDGPGGRVAGRAVREGRAMAERLPATPSASIGFDLRR